jgi:hypothetical protein
MDKITVVRYKSESIISPGDQIPDLKQHLDQFIPDLFNWASSAPKQLIKLQTRSKIYREILKTREKGNERGFLIRRIPQNYILARSF